MFPRTGLFHSASCHASPPRPLHPTLRTLGFAFVAQGAPAPHAAKVVFAANVIPWNELRGGNKDIRSFRRLTELGPWGFS